MKRRCFHRAREGIGGSRDVGSEQNYFEGGFIQLNPQTPALYMQWPSFTSVRLPAPAGPSGTGSSAQTSQAVLTEAEPR